MPQKAGPNVNAWNLSKITSIVNSKAPLVTSFSVLNIPYGLRHTLLEIKLHSLCMTRTPFQSLFVHFDEKKHFQNAVRATVPWLNHRQPAAPFVLKLMFWWFRTNQPTRTGERAQGAIDCPTSARPTTIKPGLGHYLPLQMLTMHLVEVARQTCCTTMSGHLS